MVELFKLHVKVIANADVVLYPFTSFLNRWNSVPSTPYGEAHMEELGVSIIILKPDFPGLLSQNRLKSRPLNAKFFSDGVMLHNTSHRLGLNVVQFIFEAIDLYLSNPKMIFVPDFHSLRSIKKAYLQLMTIHTIFSFAVSSLLHYSLTRWVRSPSFKKSEKSPMITFQSPSIN